MSVRLIDGMVRLEGECAVEDAEALLALVLQNPSAPVSLRDCTRLHLACAQVLLAARSPIGEAPLDPFLRDLLLPLLGRLPD
jgi:hypothetical protein